MATYIIGDIHGCFSTLQGLLREIGFAGETDRLILAGDLVNAGPDSERVLAWAVDNRVETVLGNHDLHLLAVTAGIRPLKKSDTFGGVLASAQRERWLGWLRSRPLLVTGAGFAVSHAGLLPAWSLSRARDLAGEVETALRGPDWERFLAGMYGDWPDRWDESLRGADRLRLIVNAFTRLRMVTAEGRVDAEFKGPPEAAPPGLRPWYEGNAAVAEAGAFFFGHWAAHGARRIGPVTALDSGCAWGRELTAARVEDGRMFAVPSEMAGNPRKT